MIKRKKSLKKNIVIFISLVVLLLISILVYVLLDKNRYLYVLPKEQLREELEAGLDAQKIPGELIYSKLTDQGCDRNGVGLAIYYDCSFILEKYYKNNLNSTSPNAVQQSSSPEIYSFISKNKTIDRGRIQPDYRVYPPGIPPLSYDSTLAKKITSQLSEKEYVAGWKYKITYWYCSKDTVFQLPCPVPPSPVK